MQRIDENTYIDDMLVTCADYQLFIDEMREQRKCYQPDHWTSYQFPAGQADAPILGVRPSDALAFCEWRTQREDDRWHYRLLTSSEVEQYPLSMPAKSHLGYWIMGLHAREFDFAWIGGNVPTGVNPLKLPAEFTRALKRDTDLSIHLAQAFFSELQSADLRLSALGTLMNFVALRDRIAGRSPAFEEIRIVKERVKP